MSTSPFHLMASLILSQISIYPTPENVPPSLKLHNSLFSGFPPKFLSLLILHLHLLQRRVNLVPALPPSLPLCLLYVSVTL